MSPVAAVVAAVLSVLSPSRFPEGLIPVEDIDSSTLPGIQAQFDERVAAGDKVILFRLNSFGGEVFAGMDFIQHVDDAKHRSGVRVQCVVDSRAMSMGAAFLESFCDERYMTRRSMLMFHGSSTTAKGKADDLESELSETHAMNEALANLCSARMHITTAEYHAKTDHLNWFLAADEALKVGAIDGFADPSDLPAPWPVTEAVSATSLLKALE